MPATLTSLAAAWPAIRERLRPLHGKAVDVWLAQDKVVPIDVVDGVLALECPNALYQMTITGRLGSAIIAAASEILGLPVTQVVGRVTARSLGDHERRKREAEVKAVDVPAPVRPVRGSARSALPWGQGFKLLDQFVVGSTNRMAYDAMRDVLDRPESGVNPIFIHGKSGLGKTHLEQGLALAYKERNPDAKVLYLRCEQFTNEWLNALAAGPKAINAFRVRLRHADLLLIDDIHFLSQGAKPSTTKELFETFVALSDQGRKVVFTSDAGPRDIKYLEDSFVGRFIGGLVVELQRPDADLRREVVRAKAAALGVTLAHDVVDYVACRITENIRELEGAVNTLVSFARSFSREPDIDVVREALSDLLDRYGGETLTQRIQREVADHYGVMAKDLVGKGRSGPLSTARHVAMYVMKMVTGGSYAEVGREFSAGHTNVIYACDKVKGYCLQDPEVEAFVRDLIVRTKRA